MINSNIYDYVNVLDKAADASWMRQEAISNNIANVNTPGFKKSDVLFESMLAKELGFEKDKKLQMVRTQDKHMPMSAGEKVTAKIQLQDTTTMRVDGNNVDIDVEMANLAKNQIYYNAMAKKIGSYIQGVKNVITSK